jgi:hypothetical protein
LPLHPEREMPKRNGSLPISLHWPSAAGAQRCILRFKPAQHGQDAHWLVASAWTMSRTPLYGRSRLVPLSTQILQDARGSKGRQELLWHGKQAGSWAAGDATLVIALHPCSGSSCCDARSSCVPNPCQVAMRSRNRHPQGFLNCRDERYSAINHPLQNVQPDRGSGLHAL